MTFMPKFKQPAQHITNDHHANLEAELLFQISRDGLAKLLSGQNLAASESVYRTRLEAELQTLEERGYCGYYLIVADYVGWAKDNGIAVGPGRGSGPCSLVGFLLGITQIDPIKYDLPFERFINPDKNSVPDFDVDFCALRCDEVTRYIQTKYGSNRVAHISSEDNTPLPARLVIGDRPLAELIPVYLNPELEFLVTNLTISQVSAAGLVQFNVINQTAITKLQYAVHQLAKKDTLINLDSIELNDSKAYRLLSAGVESNIAELDGEHYKTALTTIRPDRFEELCAAIALCYSSLQGSLSLYTERKRNPASISYAHPALQSVTAETYGIILYQEQLMHITHKIAGFTMSQGDLFRRVLKSANREAISQYQTMFIDGAIDYGLSKVEATDLYAHIAWFGRSTFNKSHALAYAMIAYKTAWIKANYPDIPMT